jgi:uncharacterized protein DUF4279
VTEWARATLRVSSATMVPAEITERLAREPTSAFEKGTLMSPRNPRSQRREEALWVLESDLPDGSDLQAQLEWAAGTVAALRDRLASLPPGSVDLFIGWEPPGRQNGFELHRELLAKLDGVPLDIIFDVYVAGRSAEND